MLGLEPGLGSLLFWDMVWAGWPGMGREWAGPVLVKSPIPLGTGFSSKVGMDMDSISRVGLDSDWVPVPDWD